MSEITAIFSDVGGVLGTNGWDRVARRSAAEKFHLDLVEFEDRHELVANAFDIGQLSLEEYLTRTVFYRPRDFSRDAFRNYMYAVSQPFTESLEIVGRAAGSRRYLMATLNNESLELNLDRIERFGLRKYFSVFFSSCFLGMKKPDVQIYRLALALTQRVAGESLFIDDRPLNIECARSCGMQVLRYESPAQMEGELRRLGIAV